MHNKMNKEKIEKSIIIVGKVINLARKISGKIFSLVILYFFALAIIIFLMWEVETVSNMKKFEAFMLYLVFLIFFIIMPWITQLIIKGMKGYYYTQLYIMSFLLLLISGIVGFVMIGSPFFENPNTKTIYATLNLGIGSALMVSEIVKNCKEEKRKKKEKLDNQKKGK